jgi:formamidopyrimidine-DNA glycosylase
MPELPEVETTVRSLRQPLVGLAFTGVCTSWPRHIATPEFDELERRILGRRVEAIERRGKYLVFTLDEGETLIIHLKMSGHLSVVEQNIPIHQHVHTVFSLSNGCELHFRDQRKFGRVYLVKEPDEVLGGLGPEPLEPTFTEELLKERLRGRTRALKPLLLEQAFIAGVGNIYANEALYYARIDPTRPADTLSQEDIKALHAAIQKSLRLGLEYGGASIDQYRKPDGSKGQMQNAFAVHGREGESCVRCQGLIQRTVVGGRSTYFCPTCQK